MVKTRGTVLMDNYAWIILALLLLAQLVMSMGVYAWGPLAPFIMGEYGVNRAKFGLLSSVMYATIVIVAFPSGFMVDKLGARIMLILSLIYGASLLFYSLSQNFSLSCCSSGLKWDWLWGNKSGFNERNNAVVP